MIKIGIFCKDQLCKCRMGKIVNEVLDEVKIVVEFEVYQNSNEILEKIENDEFDSNAVILDIDNSREMLDVAKRIKKHNFNIDILFLAKTKEYIFNCLDIGAYNYILKEESEIERLREQLKKLIIQKNFKRGKVMVIKRKGKYTKLRVGEIEYVEVVNRILYIKYRGEKIEVNGQISKMEEELKKFRFIRCHREIIVNLYFIRAIEKNKIILLSKEVLPISRARVKEVKEIFTVFNTNRKLIINDN